MPTHAFTIAKPADAASVEKRVRRQAARCKGGGGMTLSRALRRLICRGLIGLMLFTQLAVAGHACPGLSLMGAPAQATQTASGHDQGVHADPMAGMSANASEDRVVTCDEMAGASDKASPNLCAEHCHHGEQSSQVHAPATPAVALVSLYTVAPTAPEAAPPMSATAASVDVPVAATTPHAILHCVFRI